MLAPFDTIEVKYTERAVDTIDVKYTEIYITVRNKEMYREAKKCRRAARKCWRHWKEEKISNKTRSKSSRETMYVPLKMELKTRITSEITFMYINRHVSAEPYGVLRTACPVALKSTVLLPLSENGVLCLMLGDGGDFYCAKTASRWSRTIPPG